MNNLERWQLYCRDFSSPQSFVDFGYYSLVSACLQRRVWVGPVHAPLFANTYTIFCAPPGVGKGLVISQLTKFLTHFKLGKTEVPSDIIDDGKTDKINGNIFKTESVRILGKSKLNEYNNLLIPLAPQATTFQALIRAMANSYTGFPYKTFDGKWKQYMHSSLCFCLEELHSIMRAHSEDLSRFLQEAYDCRRDYKYETISRELDVVQWPCLNLIAGTTPEFMQSIFTSKLVGEGFSSRGWFICEESNRFNKMFIGELDIEQQKAQTELFTHIKDLTKVFGPVQYDTGVEAFLEDWWSKYDRSKRANTNAKLDYYYGRKNIHTQKLACIIHFSENADPHDMVIRKHEVEKAMFLLAGIEKKMHLALTIRGDSPIVRASRKLFSLLEKEGRATFNEIWNFVWDECPQKSLVEELLESMQALDKIVLTQDEKSGKHYYTICKK